MLREDVIKTIKTDNNLQYALAKLVGKEAQTIDRWARNKKSYAKLLDYRILYSLSIYLKTDIESLLINEEVLKDIDHYKNTLKIS